MKIMSASKGTTSTPAASHSYCKLGEIAGVLREEFREYKEPKTL